MSNAEVEHAEVRSSIKIETTAKGLATVRVSVYAGETEEEMERLKNLAVTAYEKTIAQLGARAQFS